MITTLTRSPWAMDRINISKRQVLCDKDKNDNNRLNWVENGLLFLMYFMQFVMTCIKLCIIALVSLTLQLHSHCNVISEYLEKPSRFYRFVHLSETKYSSGPCCDIVHENRKVFKLDTQLKPNYRSSTVLCNNICLVLLDFSQLNSVIIDDLWTTWINDLKKVTRTDTHKKSLQYV